LLDVLENAIKYLLARATNPDQIQKQKKLAKPISVFLKSVSLPKDLQEYKNFLLELVKLHNQHKTISGRLLLQEINLDKYETIKRLISEIPDDFPYDEIDDFIDLLMVKAHAEEIKRTTNKLIDSFAKYPSMSDHEIVDNYKSIIISEYLKIIEYNNDTDVLEFDPNDIDKLFDTIDILNTQAENKLKIPSGYPYLDEFLNGGFEAGRIYLFGSPPGMGKSTLMLNFVTNMASTKFTKKMLQSTKPPAIIYVTLENEPLETYERIARMITKTPLRIRDLSPQQKEDLKQHLLDKIKTKFIIHYEKPGSNISNLITSISTYAETHRIVAIFIDYLDLLHYDLANIKEKRHELGAITFTLKLLGKTYKCPVISPTQLNTAGYPDKFSKKISIPTMKNLDESRQKAQNADFVGLMFPIHRDFIPHKLAAFYDKEGYDTFFGINIDKNRDGKTGMITGVANFNIYSIILFNKKDSDNVVYAIRNGTEQLNNQNNSTEDNRQWTNTNFH
jgi:replicative DNA helicase